jgi:hypothetical protein
MDALNLDTGEPATPETEAERNNRHAWEAEGLERARFDRRRLLCNLRGSQCVDR